MIGHGTFSHKITAHQCESSHYFITHVAYLKTRRTDNGPSVDITPVSHINTNLHTSIVMSACANDMGRIFSHRLAYLLSGKGTEICLPKHEDSYLSIKTAVLMIDTIKRNIVTAMFYNRIIEQGHGSLT